MNSGMLRNPYRTRTQCGMMFLRFHRLSNEHHVWYKQFELALREVSSDRLAHDFTGPVDVYNLAKILWAYVFQYSHFRVRFSQYCLCFFFTGGTARCVYQGCLFLPRRLHQSFVAISWVHIKSSQNTIYSL